MELSKYQEDIMSWVKDDNPFKRNLIVPARAGSGKTFTAIHAGKFMNGRVFMGAFNNKAAATIAYRLKKLGLARIESSTMHAAGKRNLYRAMGKHNVVKDKVFWIVDKLCSNDEDLMKCRNFIKNLVSYAKQYAFGVKGQVSIESTQDWMDIINHHDMNLEFDDVDFGQCVEVAKAALRESNKDFKNIDFDDMIYLPLLLDIQFEQYDWVVIDEAQDTNVCRKLIAAKLVKPGGRMIFIGDEGQAIYGFTGAENDSMNILKEMFDCQVLPLPVCYRCGSKIIESAQQYYPDIIAHESTGEGFIGNMAYQQFLADASGMVLNKTVGVVCRNNAPNVALAFALIRQGIGCRIEGRDIGNDLKKLVNKWKRVKNLEEFTVKLTEHFTKLFEKASYAQLQLLEDKLDTMIILIDRVMSLGKNDLQSLSDLITQMFTDSTDENVPDIVTLSSIHKAKGLEWETVYWLGNAQFSPSKYAKLEWMMEQERNLQYVACTRAMKNLIHITDCPTRRNREE